MFSFLEFLTITSSAFGGKSTYDKPLSPARKIIATLVIIITSGIMYYMLFLAPPCCPYYHSDNHDILHEKFEIGMNQKDLILLDSLLNFK